jgi:DNA-binding HxlR family transcriptional regulator
MKEGFRSNCPLNYGLEFFGDKWSLLIIRDIMLFDKRYFNEFLKSAEGISTNILRDRLRSLEKNGLIRKKETSEHKQKIKYTLTLKAIQLLPILVEILFWSEKQTEDLHPNRDQIFHAVKKDKEKGIELISEKLKREHLN